MTVAELIAELQKLPPDAPVLCHSRSDRQFWSPEEVRFDGSDAILLDD